MADGVIRTIQRLQVTGLFATSVNPHSTHERTENISGNNSSRRIATVADVTEARSILYKECFRCGLRNRKSESCPYRSHPRANSDPTKRWFKSIHGQEYRAYNRGISSLPLNSLPNGEPYDGPGSGKYVRQQARTQVRCFSTLATLYEIFVCF